MTLTQIAKDDLMMTVYIELERMFTVLSNRNSPDKGSFIDEVEATIKSSLAAYAPYPQHLTDPD